MYAHICHENTAIPLKYSSHKIFSEKPQYFHFSNILHTKCGGPLSRMLEKRKYRGFSEKILCKKSFIDEAPGTARVPKCREETTKFNFLGFWCNHVVLEPLQAKNLPKRARDHQKSQNFQGFWPLAALKPRNCTRNLKNRIVWFPPDILVPLLSQGVRQ